MTNRNERISTKRSRAGVGPLDCFAALAMTDGEVGAITDGEVGAA